MNRWPDRKDSRSRVRRREDGPMHRPDEAPVTVVAAGSDMACDREHEVLACRRHGCRAGCGPSGIVQSSTCQPET